MHTNRAALLQEAEAHERQAASERVAYFSALLAGAENRAQRLLDVGCGNGYSVARWSAQGADAFGVDRSLYRMGRWATERRRGRGGDTSSPLRLVVADATRLPFAASAFDVVISSGMIEHVGVREASSPYTVTPHSDRDKQRERVVHELARVTRESGVALVDCPNGAFPIDFWHGDRIGAFRVHRIPDSLLASHGQLLSWGKAAGLQARLQPLGRRLRFRQIKRRWWGRVLSPVVELSLRLLDHLISTPLGTVVGCLYPYVVVSYRKPDRLQAGGGA